MPALLGGAVEKVWFALAREFATQGHQVTHVGRSFQGLPNEETDGGVRYLRVRGYDAPASLLKLKLLDLLYSRRVQKVLPKADILITNTFWLPFLERRRDRGHVYIHVVRYPKGQLRMYPKTTTLQTVSEPVREAILRETGCDPARTRVIPNPVSLLYLVDRPSPGSREILYAGRLHPEKGVGLLIDAFARLRSKGITDWTLRILGPWETRHGGGGERYRSGLLRQAEACRGNVIFSEPIFDERSLIEHYRKAALFVYPSLAEKGETFGLAILEAMGAGCAPVVSALECFRDFVTDGSNGLIFDHRSADPAGALAAKIESLILDPGQLEKLRSAAWATARDYALPQVAHQFLRDFDELLQLQSGLPVTMTRGAIPAQHL